MDVGRFLRRPWELIVWVVVPPVLACVFSGGARLYAEVVDSERLTGSALLAFLPDAQKRIKATETALAPLRAAYRNEAEAIADMGMRINRVASDCGLTVEDLSVTPQKAGVAGQLLISFRGHGEAGQVARFLQDIQRVEKLVALDKSTISLTSPAPRAEYAANITMRFSLLQE